MSKKQKILGVYGACLAFLVLVVFCIIKDLAWVPLLVPVALITVCLYFFALKDVMLIIVFSVPLSVNLIGTEFGISIGIPDEIMLILFVLMFIFKMCFDGKIDKDIISHPVTICIFIVLFWMFVCSITSSMPIVSFKYLAARLWFVIPCYFVAIRIFKENQKNIIKYNWAYIIAFTIVIIYTIINHAMHGFSAKSGLWVMFPFFPEHTCYGAMLVFMIPFIVYYLLSSEYSLLKRMAALVLLVLFVIATYLSFTRAAWISAVMALLVALAFLLKIKFKYAVVIVTCLVGLFFAFEDQILITMQRNNTESSQNFVDHIKSMTNISSDASNLERINRWSCAIRMFEERPVVGWGPGTYQFVYAPFQRAREETIISTNAGDVGNCHSEYFGPLSEQGLPGLILVFALMISIFATGGRVYMHAKDRNDRHIVLFCMLAFVTYYTHGLMNNFLDIDKAAVPFWLYVAMIVSLDIKIRNIEKQNAERQSVDNKELDTADSKIDSSI